MNFDGPELALLLLCCRTQLSDAESEDLASLSSKIPEWEQVFALSKRHKIDGFLLKHGSNYLPEDVRVRLQQRRAATTQANLRLTSELIHLLNDLMEIGIKAIPYKGPVLMQQVYGDVGLRATHDIDILIDPTDRIKCEKLVRRRGYLPDTETSSFGLRVQNWLEKDAKWHNPANDVILEVHWRFAKWYFPFPLDGRSFTNGLRQWEWSGQTFSLMPREETLLTLCLHGSLHQWPCLEMLMMVAEFCKQNNNLDWERLQRIAQHPAAIRSMWLGLSLAHKHLEAPVPESILIQANADPVIDRLMQQVEAQWLSERSERELVNNMHFDLSLLASRRTRLRYLFGLSAVALLRPFTTTKRKKEEVKGRVGDLIQRHSLSPGRIAGLTSRLLRTD